MTPEEFYEKMLEMKIEYDNNGDVGETHVKQDNLMCDLLR